MKRAFGWFLVVTGALAWLMAGSLDLAHMRHASTLRLVLLGAYGFFGLGYGLHLTAREG